MAKREIIKLLNVVCFLLAALSYISCGIIEPSPIVNDNAQQTFGDITIRDQNNQVYYDDQEISGNWVLIMLVPDSASVYISIDSISINSLELIKYEYTWGNFIINTTIAYQWVESTVNNKIIFKTKGWLNGMNHIRLTYRVYDSNSGLEHLIYKERIINLKLNYH